MTKIEKDEVRENRIDDEVIVDAYGPEEQIMGWYCYLDEKLEVPFTAKCIELNVISPLELNEEVEVIGMATDSACEKGEMFVMINWQGRKLAVPLSQLAVVDSDEMTREAVEDWHYWVNRGYQF